MQEGIVPGGGATLAHLAENLLTWAKINLKEDELIGAIILSLMAPETRFCEFLVVSCLLESCKQQFIGEPD